MMSLLFYSPVYCYGDLLDAVQRSNIFPDSKTFVDRPLKASPEVILSSFTASPPTQLHQFVLNQTTGRRGEYILFDITFCIIGFSGHLLLLTLQILWYENGRMG